MVSMRASVVAVAMALAMLLILELVFYRIRYRRTRCRAQQRLELASFTDLVAQSTTRAAAYDGSDEALFTVGLLLGAVGRWGCCTTAVLSLSWGCVAAICGGGVLWLLGCTVAVVLLLLLRVGVTRAVIICCRHFGRKFLFIIGLFKAVVSVSSGSVFIDVM